MLLIASVANAATLISDPQEGVTDYKLVCNSTTTFHPAQPDGSASIDRSGQEVGTVDCLLYAGRAWTLNGEPQEAIEWGPASIPFDLGRPSVPLSSTGIGLE
jgi:hypothetical protein